MAVESLMRMCLGFIEHKETFAKVPSFNIKYIREISKKIASLDNSFYDEKEDDCFLSDANSKEP